MTSEYLNLKITALHVADLLTPKAVLIEGETNMTSAGVLNKGEVHCSHCTIDTYAKLPFICNR